KGRMQQLESEDYLLRRIDQLQQASNRLLGIFLETLRLAHSFVVPLIHNDSRPQGAFGLDDARCCHLNFRLGLRYVRRYRVLLLEQRDDSLRLFAASPLDMGCVAEPKAIYLPNHLSADVVAEAPEVQFASVAGSEDRCLGNHTAGR